MADVVMPQLGESVVEGTVTKWRVREGDLVEREQVLLEVATDKADTEVNAPVGGKVTKIVAPEGAVVQKGGLLCTIDDTARAAASAPAQGTTPAAGGGGNGGREQRPLMSPATRHLARETGVDPGRVQPTGEHGRVTRDDVLRAAQPSGRDARPSGETSGPPSSTPVVQIPSLPAPAAAPAITEHPSVTPAAVELGQLLSASGGWVPPVPGVGYGSYKVPSYSPKQGDEVIPFSRRRRITADHMVYSKATSPHVATVAEIDLFATAKLRDQHKEQLKKEGVNLTFLAFVCAAAVRALREFPHMNARVLDSSVVVLKDIHLGVAVDTPGGLIVPSIKHADRMSLRGIASSIDEMAGKARANKISADDLAGTTFSISNPGLKGNLFGMSIISQPNVGILRMGEIKKRVVVVTKDGEDSIAIHPVMFMALSYDHRVIDGVLANSFLWRVSDILTRGEFEL